MRRYRPYDPYAGMDETQLATQREQLQAEHPFMPVTGPLENAPQFETGTTGGINPMATPENSVARPGKDSIFGNDVYNPFSAAPTAGGGGFGSPMQPVSSTVAAAMNKPREQRTPQEQQLLAERSKYEQQFLSPQAGQAPAKVTKTVKNLAGGGNPKVGSITQGLMDEANVQNAKRQGAYEAKMALAQQDGINSVIYPNVANKPVQNVSVADSTGAIGTWGASSSPAPYSAGSKPGYMLRDMGDGTYKGVSWTKSNMSDKQDATYQSMAEAMGVLRPPMANTSAPSYAGIPNGSLMSQTPPDDRGANEMAPMASPEDIANPEKNPVTPYNPANSGDVNVGPFTVGANSPLNGIARWMVEPSSISKKAQEVRDQQLQKANPANSTPANTAAPKAVSQAPMRSMQNMGMATIGIRPDPFSLYGGMPSPSSFSSTYNPFAARTTSPTQRISMTQKKLSQPRNSGFQLSFV